MSSITVHSRFWDPTRTSAKSGGASHVSDARWAPLQVGAGEVGAADARRVQGGVGHLRAGEAPVVEAPAGERGEDKAGAGEVVLVGDARIGRARGDVRDGQLAFRAPAESGEQRLRRDHLRLRRLPVRPSREEHGSGIAPSDAAPAPCGGEAVRLVGELQRHLGRDGDRRRMGHHLLGPCRDARAGPVRRPGDARGQHDHVGLRARGIERTREHRATGRRRRRRRRAQAARLGRSADGDRGRAAAGLRRRIAPWTYLVVRRDPVRLDAGTVQVGPPDRAAAAIRRRDRLVIAVEVVGPVDVTEVDRHAHRESRGDVLGDELGSTPVPSRFARPMPTADLLAQ